MVRIYLVQANARMVELDPSTDWAAVSPRFSLILVALVSLSLAGCSAPSATVGASDSAVADQTQLLAEFSDALCPAVVADTAFNEIWVDQSSTLEQIVGAATEASDAGTTASTTVDGMAGSWPADFRDDLLLVRDLYVGKVADYDAIAKAESLEPLQNFTFGDVTAGNAAAQRIVTELGESTITC